MNQSTLTNPKVFISYSWTTIEHEEWVIELATRLMSDGIEVLLDKWELKEGHDIYAFMEKMVTDSDAIDKVLIICEKGYKEKSDSRTGGVGTEAQIITPKIYSDIQQEKFIPVVADRDVEGNHYIPTYIASRLYIDLSSIDYFEEGYEKLIRNIFKVPQFKKPTLGKAPDYLFQDDTPHFQTALCLRQMKNLINKYPNRLPYLWSDFTDTFMDSLEELQIEVSNFSEMDESVIKMIEKTLPLRNDFIHALELICSSDTLQAEQLIEFFEKIYKFSSIRGLGNSHEFQFDHYKFLIHELFLYSIVILIKFKKYVIINHLINADYYADSSLKEPKKFTDYRFYLTSLDYRNLKMKLNRISLHADLLTERSYHKYKKDLIEADLLLYYISKLIITTENYWNNIWFPTAYIYFDNYGVFKLLHRLKSKNHFSNIKSLFNVDDANELREKISNFENERGYDGFRNKIPELKDLINPKEICTSP